MNSLWIIVLMTLALTALGLMMYRNSGWDGDKLLGKVGSAVFAMFGLISIVLLLIIFGDDSTQP